MFQAEQILAAKHVDDAVRLRPKRATFYRLDVMAVLDDGVVARPELTIAADVMTRTICAALLRPAGTKGVDAAVLLARMPVPELMRPGEAFEQGDFCSGTYRQQRGATFGRPFIPVASSPHAQFPDSPLRPTR
ncbi:hypothetical protein [Streptomyces acidiscabies]|uniref:hypothetical protein n=1 Tax=Streptomyces acidiscabies TaxID=42234 RepID=UPI00067E0220|nr:hypothetical protein [Streptomyces acidiscabies]